MECPYCHTEYTSERPCFCHPPAEPKRTAREEYYTKSPAEENICVNSHRGVRLD